jgi:hypothetical protein
MIIPIDIRMICKPICMLESNVVSANLKNIDGAVDLTQNELIIILT